MTLAMRVTSWLPMKVFGVKWARKPLWRFSAQPSSKKLRSLMLDQMAFHSSYWVVASTPEDATNREWSPVDDLPEEPGIRMAAPDGGNHARPEVRVHGIGGVEPPPVDSPGEPSAP